MFDAGRSSLGAHGQLYSLLISSIGIILFLYIAYVDSKSFKIPNRSLVLLLLLYGIKSVVSGRLTMLLGDGLFAVLVLTLCLLFYSRHVLGGGDAKLLPLAFLFVGLHSALPFSILLIVFVLLHQAAIKAGWARFDRVAGRRMMPYAPSIAGAFVTTALLGWCLAR